MKRENLAGEELLMLKNEKGNICVTVIVPTHKISPERRIDRLEVERAFDKAMQQLHYHYGEEKAAPIVQKMEEMLKHMDYVHNSEGLGFYFSPRISIKKSFSFGVEEKIMVGNKFELRDLLYEMNYAKPYYVLLLSESGARLFEAECNRMEEVIRKDHFPKHYVEEFIYNPPSRSTSHSGQSHLKGFEKDKSILEEIRFKDFFRSIDHSLHSYLVQDTPLVVIAAQKELSWFSGISRHQKNIVGKIEGNYNYTVEQELADKAWEVMHKHQQQERTELIREFREKIGELRGISGIQDSWEAAKEGKGLTLLVEKDYRCPGFISENEYHLYLTPPVTRHKILADAVEELIETVLDKNGKLVFVDNGVLSDYGHIALISRY